MSRLLQRLALVLLLAVGSGVYFYRLAVPGMRFEATKSMLLVR